MLVLLDYVFIVGGIVVAAFLIYGVIKENFLPKK